jgi:hypothetical protein
VEIVVREGELGETVAAAVSQLKATTLVLGIHDKSFIYRYYKFLVRSVNTQENHIAEFLCSCVVQLSARRARQSE